MNTWTRIGLVLLRIAIGWHFLFEGLEKLESYQRGSSEAGGAVWSAEGYLREAQGPLAWWFRAQAGDPDADAIAKLSRPSRLTDLPDALTADWQSQFDRFVQHYDLGHDKALQPENLGEIAIAPLMPFPAALQWGLMARGAVPGADGEDQKTLALADLELAKERSMKWFTSGSREVPTKLPGINEKIKETTAQRISNYRKTLMTLAEMEEHGMPGFDKDVFADKYRALKREAQVQRTELLKEANKPFVDALATAASRLSRAQRERGPVPPPPPPANLERINFATRWGVTLVGACLLMGLFTRLACLGGAGFLLLFYLAMPSLPWLPLSPRSEGHYLFINKNIIEMLALLMLATTASGRWLGLDGILHYFNPFGRSTVVRRPVVTRTL